MKPAALLLLLASALPTSRSQAADDPVLNRAYQDHIAYVATFAMPLLFEKCALIDSGYLDTAAPLYFRYVSERQDQIERGRLLTLAELEPGETLGDYREKVIAGRIAPFDASDEARRHKMCEGALGVMRGAILPGEWPERN